MQPFELKLALQGYPVALRSGLKAYVTAVDIGVNYPLKVRTKDNRIFRYTLDGSCWADGIQSAMDIVGMYDTTPKFAHWDFLRGDVNYLAKDGDGFWYAYTQKPQLKKSMGLRRWLSQNGANYQLTALDENMFPECKWEESLIQRPKVKLA